MAETIHPPGRLKAILQTGIICLLVAAAIVVTAPLVLRSRKKADLTQAVSNARQIGLALLEFEQSYGSFPNDATIPAVKAEAVSDLTLGSKSSNDYFRQLLAVETTESEAIFYANIAERRIPDNEISGSLALENGECGFSYLLGATNNSPPATPLVVTPLVPGKALFDSIRSFSGKAIILRIDGSVQTHPIDKSGRVWINGNDLFDPTQPFWNGKAPVIKWPDL